jgi:hypothetical protein
MDLELLLFGRGMIGLVLVAAVSRFLLLHSHVLLWSCLCLCLTSADGSLLRNSRNKRLSYTFATETSLFLSNHDRQMLE